MNQRKAKQIRRSAQKWCERRDIKNTKRVYRLMKKLHNESRNEKV